MSKNQWKLHLKKHPRPIYKSRVEKDIDRAFKSISKSTTKKLKLPIRVKK